ncbi:MAG: hypothetical protein OXC01_17020 [Immundisolibacterales bacterium]|nr:hypothetical protein [Immundisolibacterales bacterium]
MKVLFDQGTPMPLRRHLAEHSVDTAAERGWSDVDNGALIDKAELEGYEVLVTTDQNMRHQQNLGKRRLALVVLLSTAWPRIQLRTEEIRAAIDGIRPGETRDVPI